MNTTDLKQQFEFFAKTFFLGLVLAGIAAAQSVVSFFPIAEGFSKTSVNAAIFRKNSVTSRGKVQFVAFYDASSRVVIAKRILGSKNWDITTTKFNGNTKDAHNAISIAIDGDGFLHLAWDQHGNTLNYTRSRVPEIADFPENVAMTGVNEKKVTYPEFYNLPNGDLFFLYRDGASGNGNLVLNRYDLKLKKWSRVQSNLIDGEGKRNAYAQTTVDAKGTFHVSWVWRESPDVATNHDLCYAKSTDGGVTWQKSNGERYVLPITEATAEIVRRIPQKSELINQTSMTTDRAGNPMIATYWRDSDSLVPQFRVVWFDGNAWRTSQVGERKTAFSISGAGSKKVPVSRPQIVADGKRVIVLFRDAERGFRISAAVSQNLDSNAWFVRDLSDENFGQWEPTLDQNLWQKRGILNIFAQKVGQGDGEKTEEVPPQMVSVVEWKP